ncbi:MAG: alpha/beta fold hydrolase [Pseudomonadota bacterium]|nr:alpha/beta fold hydrolase [Pseudomonadota bacterium]
MSFLLQHVIQTAPGAAPTRWAWLLHGILGSGQNLRTVARRLVAAKPDWGFVLPDLRNHGESRGAPPPHTVVACAEDLFALAAHLGIEPRSAIGHSFGGKVAMVWGARAEARGHHVERIWALDVPPGPPDIPLAAQSEVARVVLALRTVPMPLPRRDSVVELLTRAGFSAGLAQWMTTNVRPTEAGFVWRFDLVAIEEMMHDYARTDAWPWLLSRERRARVDVVRAERSERWPDAELERFGVTPQQTASETRPERLHLHVLPNAGHWVHVDNPDGLHALLVEEGLGEGDGTGGSSNS